MRKPDPILLRALDEYVREQSTTLAQEFDPEQITLSPALDHKIAALSRKQRRVYYYWTNTRLKKALCVAAALLLLMAIACIGAGAFRSPHNYLPATCTEPMKCTHCDKTVGESLGHLWIPATCTVPMTCSVCGETEGAPLPHHWMEATCTAPKTCSSCDAAVGEPIPHTYQVVSRTEPSCTKEGTLVEKCTVCGEERVRSIDKIPHAEENIPLCRDVVKCKRCGKVLFTVTPVHRFFNGKCTNCGAIDPDYNYSTFPYSLTDAPTSPFGDKGSPGIDDSFSAIPWDYNATQNLRPGPQQSTAIPQNPRPEDYGLQK